MGTTIVAAAAVAVEEVAVVVEAGAAVVEAVVAGVEEGKVIQRGIGHGRTRTRQVGQTMTGNGVTTRRWLGSLARAESFHTMSKQSNLSS